MKATYTFDLDTGFIAGNRFGLAQVPNDPGLLRFERDAAAPENVPEGSLTDLQAEHIPEHHLQTLIRHMLKMLQENASVPMLGPNGEPEAASGTAAFVWVPQCGQVQTRRR